MRILMATMRMGIGGAETHIIELCRALKKRGYEVIVASAGGALVKELTDSGIRHVTAPLDKKDPLSLARCEQILARLMRREHFTVVHAHARIPALICGRLQKRFSFRFVTSVHFDFKVNRTLRSLTDWGEHTFAVSEDLRAYLLREYGIGSEHVTVTVNGIDTDRFCAGDAAAFKRQLVPEGGLLYLHVSRLEPYSSVLASRLIEASPAFLKSRDRLCILGGGGSLAALTSLASSYNKTLMREAILLPGAQSDVLPYLRACDVFIGPSRAALEAMACEKPVVLGGSEGYIGVFRKAVYEKAMATNLCCRGEPLPSPAVLATDLLSLSSLLENEKKKVGEENRRFVSERYSVDKMAEDHIAVYEKTASFVKAKNTFDAVLCGYFGYGNMGDEAVLSALISGLREQKKDVSLCVMTASPAETAKRHAVATVNRFDFVKITSILRRSKLLIFGGGNLLQDATSNASLWYYLHILKTAKKCGAKIAVYSNGIGPVTDADNMDKIAEALRLADSVSMRERHSFELVRSLCPQSQNIRLTFDPALLTEKTEDDAILRRHGLTHKSYFVVSPRAIDRFSARKLMKILMWLSSEYSLVPVFIPMQRKEDLEVCRAMAGDVPGSLVVEENLDFASVLSLLSGAALTVSLRLHTLIYATSAVCPMFAYSEDIKLRSYLSYLGIEQAAGVSCSADNRDSEEDIRARLATVLSSSEAICASIEQGLPLFRTLARHEFSELISLINKP